MTISKDFQDLITMMLSPDHEMRIDMADIVCHPWMQGPTASRDDVINEMERRRAASKDMADQSRAGSAIVDDEGKVYRDFNLNGITYVLEYENKDQESDENYQVLGVKEIDDDDRSSRMLTSLKPDEVFTRVRDYLLNKQVKKEHMHVVDDEWKLEFEVVKTINLG